MYSLIEKVWAHMVQLVGAKNPQEMINFKLEKAVQVACVESKQPDQRSRLILKWGSIFSCSSSCGWKQLLP